VLLPNNVTEEDDPDLASDPSVLPESISIARIDELLDQMRFHEVPKRSQFSVPFELAKGFVIGVKGYGLDCCSDLVIEYDGYILGMVW
jgi:ATP-dependent DNA helicase 2 subunit 1